MMRLSITINAVGQVDGIYSNESPAIPANAILLSEADSALLHGASNLADFAYDNGQLVTNPAAIATLVLNKSALAFEQAIQWHLDSSVQARGYDNIVSCASYANSPTTTFKAEAAAAIAWRDAVWTYCYAELAKVKAGTRAIPASVDAFIAKLPPLTW